MRSSFVSLWRPAMGLPGYRVRLAVGATCMLGRIALSLVIPFAIGAAVERLEARDGEAATNYGLLVLGSAVLLCFMHIASRSLFEMASRLAIDDLRLRLFGRLLALRPRELQDRKIGDIVSLFASDSIKLRVLWGTGVAVSIHTVLTLIFAVYFMVQISGWLTLSALAPYPMTLIVFAIASPFYFGLHRAAQRQLGTLSGFVSEELAGIQILKGYCLEERNNRQFRTLAMDYVKSNLALLKVEGRVGPVVNSLQAMAIVITVAAGGKMAVEGQLTIGLLVTFLSYLALLSGPLNGLGLLVPLIQEGRAAWSRLQPLFEAHDELGGNVPSVESAASLGPVDLEVHDLTIENDTHLVLDHATLRIPAGSTCAIVGATGSGKSTLLDALLGFVEVPADTVRIGTHDITTIPRGALRRSLSYAPQDAFLFSMTIEENIAMGIRSQLDEAGRRRIVQRVADTAGLSAELGTFSDGLATVVGERGVTLSGGQRQRVALARALADDAPVIVLDDPLSAVDAEKEAEIMANILNEVRDRTIVLASHRMETFQRFDQIIVLSEGRVVEAGSHDELRARAGVYARLYDEYMLSLLGVRA